MLLVLLPAPKPEGLLVVKHNQTARGCILLYVCGGERMGRAVGNNLSQLISKKWMHQMKVTKSDTCIPLSISRS